MSNTPSLEDIISQAVVEDVDSGVEVESSKPPQPSESDRKLASMEAHMQSTQAQLDALMAQIQASQKPAPKPSKDMLYDNPEEFINQTISAAERRADERVSQRINESARLNQIVSEIQGKYAEFSQPGSEAASLALAKASKQPAHIRGTPEGARQAMLEAAMELELVPKSKRKAAAASEDYVAPGTVTAKASSPSSKQEQAQLQFLHLLAGDKANDKEMQKEFAKAQKRKDWRNPQ